MITHCVCLSFYYNTVVRLILYLHKPRVTHELSAEDGFLSPIIFCDYRDKQTPQPTFDRLTLLICARVPLSSVANTLGEAQSSRILHILYPSTCFQLLSELNDIFL